MRQFMLMVVVLGSASTAQGDIPRADRPPNVEIRFENFADYPDHDFYLKYGRTAGDPYSAQFLTRVTSASPLRLQGTGERLTPVYLLAVPRGQQLPSPPGFGHPDQYTWLEAVPQGGAQALVKGHLGGGLAESHGQQLTYRIDLDDGEMTVRLTAPGSGLEGGRNNWPLIAAAGAFSVGLTGAVVWMFRRSRRSNGVRLEEPLDQT